MKLTDHDLRQIDAEYLARLSPEQLLHVSERLLADLKEARDRANQTPHNSSRPPGSFAPWEGQSSPREDPEPESPQRQKRTSRGGPPPLAGPETPAPPVAGAAAAEPPAAARKPGKQPGSAGHGRQVTLPVTGEEEHRAAHCGACGADLTTADFVARTGMYVLDVEMHTPGLAVTHVKHVYGDTPCACGHVTRTTPGRCAPEKDWRVALTEWHLVGPTLAALLCVWPCGCAYRGRAFGNCSRTGWGSR